MGIQVVNIDESKKWGKIVKSFKDYDIYYLSEYVKAFQLHNDGEPLLFYFDNGSTRAINVVMKRDIAKDMHFAGKIEENTYFDLSTPYGYGGFLVEGNDYQALNEQYIQWCRNENIVSEFVRFHPLLNNGAYSLGIYETAFLGNTIFIDVTDIDKIWGNLISQNRNKVRKAQKSNLYVYWGRDEWLANEFIHIYNLTMEKDNANKYYFFKKNFYESILNDLKYNFLIFYTKLYNEIIAMAIILFCNNKMHYHLSGSQKKFQHLAPTNLLLYEAACWGAANGYREFHLGGGVGTKEDSLYKFKKAFNKNEDKEFHIGKAVFNEEIYECLLDIRKKESDFDTESSYFPKYRS